MLYYIEKYLSKIGFRVFFRKIYFSNQESIQNDKPIIFVVNHPTAFLDPVLIAVFLGPIVHFIVRGDVFNSKFVRAILASLKMYPIFRFRDGFSNLKNNQATMDLCYKFLSQSKNILILAEGETKHEKRLRPIQKGAARMAFGAIEKYGDLDILVVPIGVNYTDSNRFRSEVMMEVGEAIPLKKMMPVYRENPRKAIKQLTDEISIGLRKHVIHVADEADDELVDKILDIQRNDLEKSFFPMVSSSNKLLKKEYKTVEIINKMDHDEKEALSKTLSEYKKELNQHNLKDLGIAQFQKFNFVNSIFIILGFVPFLIGALINGLPLFMAKRFADHKVKKIEFHSSVRYAVGLFGYQLYWLIFFVIALISGNNIFVIAVLVAPFLGFFSLFYDELLMKWKAARKFTSLSKEEKNLLRNKRELLFEQLHSRD